MMDRRQEVPAPPSTTIPPFQDPAVFPACAINCPPLYDANGACVPPNVPVGNPDTYDSCFCSHGAVAPFSVGVSGVCDAACGPDGLSSIADWFRDLCDVEDGGGATGTTSTTTGGAASTTTTGGSSDSDGSGGNSGDGGGGGDWLSNHWQWVIMLVVLVVGIAGIWIGACLWRRRYLKKKDRQSTIGQKQSGSASHPSWGPGFAENAAAGAPNNVRDSLAATPQSEDARTRGSFMPGASAAALEEGSEKRSSRRWIPKSRT